MKKVKISGVYKITNPEGKVYVGSSKDIELRISKGYKNKHGNKRKRHIDISINYFGFENHIFETIEACEQSVLSERERHWQEELNCLYPNGLNRNLVKTSTKKQQHCEDTIRVISEKKMGTPAWNRGIPTSESTKKTIKDRYSPLQRSVCRLIMDTRTGVFYYCAREAAEAINMHVNSLRGNLKAPNKDYRTNKTHLIYV